MDFLDCVMSLSQSIRGTLAVLRIHDIPNWLAVFVWPIIVFSWRRWPVGNIPNLRIILSNAGRWKEDIDKLHLQFTNDTGSIVYLRDVRFRPNRRRIRVWSGAARDVSEDTYELKFVDKSINPPSFALRQIILNTGQSELTELGIENLSDEVLNYSGHWLRKIFRRPKYFKLMFTIMLGDKKDRVVMTY